MNPFLEIQVHCFCVGIFHESESGSLFLCRDISWVRRTNEISLHKNNSPGSPDKDTPLTGSCYNIREICHVVAIFLNKQSLQNTNKIYLVTTLNSFEGFYKPFSPFPTTPRPNQIGQHLYPYHIYISPLVNNKYPLMSLNCVTYSEQCNWYILSLWCDYILQWNEHGRVYHLNVTSFLTAPLSINFLPFHQTFTNVWIGFSHLCYINQACWHMSKILCNILKGLL